MRASVLVLGALFGIFGANACSRGKDPEPPFVGWTAECTTSANAEGAWTTVVPPSSVLGIAGLAPRHQFSDGETFTVVREQSIAFLGRGDTEWSTDTADRAPTITGWVWAASPDYLVIQGGATTDYGREYTSTLESLDSAAARWTTVLAPSEIPLGNSPTSALWTSKEFLFWGNYVPVILQETAALNSDAVLFDPTSKSWRTIPSPIPPYEYSLDLPEGISGHVDAAWGRFGLAAWGIFPDTGDTFGLVLGAEDETWRILAQGPTSRRHFDVVASDDGFYVVGGIHPDSDGTWDWFGEIWFYSLEDDAWSQIKVPSYVDPKQGAWLDGKLYVFGECASDAVYDPADGSWAHLPALEIPDYGVPMVAGGRIFLTEVTDPHGDDIPEIYIYDPSAGAAGVGGASN